MCPVKLIVSDCDLSNNTKDQVILVVELNKPIEAKFIDVILHVFFDFS